LQISAALAVWLCAAFALICLGFAYSAFSGLATLTDAADRDISAGYGWFWVFSPASPRSSACFPGS
jgi:hypothetical protein